MTAIELLVVMSIAAILAGIGLPVLIKGFAKANISKSSNDLLRVQSMAKELALAQQRPDYDEPMKSYGVRLEPSGDSFMMTLIYGTNISDTLFADDDDDGQPDPNGRPVAQFKLPTNAEIWIDDGDDGATTPGTIIPQKLDKPIGWFIQAYTGMPVRFAADPYNPFLRDPHPISIGVPSQGPTRCIWTNGDTVSTNKGSGFEVLERETPALLAPQDIYLRHLSVRSKNGSTVRLISVYSVGVSSETEGP